MIRTTASPAVLLLALAGLPAATADLVGLLALVRHGNRAANTAVTSVCPKIAGDSEKILEDFGVGPGLLTAVGAAQMAETGVFMRQHYLGDGRMRLAIPLDSTGWSYVHVLSRNQSRHVESVRSLGVGMLGSTPPLIHIPVTPKDELDCPTGVCGRANNQRVVQWDKDVGMKVNFNTSKRVLRKMGEMCGHTIVPEDYPTTGNNPHPPFQDIVDLFDFRAEEGLSLPAEWPTVREEAEALSYQSLRERLFGTVEQKVYWAADFPHRVLRGLSTAGVPGNQPMELLLGSREMHYAVAEYFGFTFDVPGETPGSIVPAFALFFEFHVEAGVRFVRVRYFYPQSSPTDTLARPGALKSVAVPGCDPELCTLEQLEALIARRTAEVGGRSYVDLCEEAENRTHTEVRNGAKPATADKKSGLFAVLTVACVIASAAMAVGAVLARRAPQSPPGPSTYGSV